MEEGAVTLEDLDEPTSAVQIFAEFDALIADRHSDSSGSDSDGEPVEPGEFIDPELARALARAASGIEELQQIAASTSAALAAEAPAPAPEEPAEEEQADGLALLDLAERSLAAAGELEREQQGTTAQEARARRDALNQQAWEQDRQAAAAEEEQAQQQAEARLAELNAELDRETAAVEAWQDDHRRKAAECEQAEQEEQRQIAIAVAESQQMLEAAEQDASRLREQLAMAAEERLARLVAVERRDCERERHLMAAEQRLAEEVRLQVRAEQAESAMMRAEDRAAAGRAAAKLKLEAELEASRREAARRFEEEQRHAETVKLAAELGRDQLFGLYKWGRGRAEAGSAGIGVNWRDWCAGWANSKMESCLARHPVCEELDKAAACWASDQPAQLTLAYEQVCDMAGLNEYTGLLSVSMPGNRISSLDGIGICTDLVEVNLSQNQLGGTDGALTERQSIS